MFIAEYFQQHVFILILSVKSINQTTMGHSTWMALSGSNILSSSDYEGYQPRMPKCSVWSMFHAMSIDNGQCTLCLKEQGLRT
jgi:hypothetical protein